MQGGMHAADFHVEIKKIWPASQQTEVSKQRARIKVE